MPKLNLETKNKAQELIKAYLEENASAILADKINNGVRIQKDGKTLISKKTLDGFMTYATNEAKKQAEKSARSACIEDAMVYGWAVHYFEEDTIEGTLYNEDGTEYKPQKPAAKPKPAVSSPAPAASKPKPQMSLFDMLDAPSNEQTTPSETEEPDEQDIPDDEDDVISEEEQREILAEIAAEEEQERAAAEQQREIEQKPVPKPAGSPLWQNYTALQSKYPEHILTCRVGDFYEVFGENAKLLAEPLNLTLTSRDCGLAERVLMVGFPYHAADNYISKAVESSLKIAVAESFDEPVKLYEQQTAPQPPVPDEPVKHWVDEKTYIDEDGVVHNLDEETDDGPTFDIAAFDTEALAILDELLGNQIEMR